MAITCNCPARCEIHPKYAPKEPVELNTAADVIPQLEVADKLTLKTLEAESLKSQIEAQQIQQQAMMKAQMAYQQLQQFCAAMFDKHGLKQSDWSLDLSKLEFTKREQPAK